MFRNLPRLRQALTPIALAIVSLVAAVALWIAVTETENPTSDQELPFNIPVEPIGVPDGLAVLSLSPDAVVVTVRATDDTFDRLTASNFRATVNMTGIRDTQSTQNIIVEVVGLDEEEVRIVSSTSQSTRVVLEAEVTKTVPVQINRLGSLAQGFTISGTETTPENVTVVGPSSSVNLVQHADVDVNLTGVRSNIQIQYELTPRDAGGAVQPRVRVEPAAAEVRISVQQLETPQIVPVLVDFQGEIAAGYNIVSITPEPRTVLVSGSVEILQTLDYLSTNPIDVTGARETIDRTVTLQIPTGIEAERNNVEVTIEIEPAAGERAITVAPTVVNVPDGLNAVIQTSTLTVRVTGDTPVLNQLTPSDVQATVDVSGLLEGVHTLDIEVQLPDDVTLEAIEPMQAVIALRP